MSRPVALVTGASSGIGRAFAVRLAADGHDLVIVARDVERLKELAEEVPTDVEVFPADLTDPVALSEVESRASLRDRPIDLLVNNAGFGTTGKFAELPIEGEEKEIRLNIVALVRLTRAALPEMIERGRGGIINVASVAGFQPTSGTSTYGATKAFVINFTEALHEEVRGTGVKIQVLCPGFTRTEFQARASYDAARVPGVAWMSPEAVVDASVRALARGKAICIPGAVNQIAAAAGRLAPRGVVRRISKIVGGSQTG